MHWQRTFLHPMLANFDAPTRDECAAARIVSNTPQQALTLLNDPTFVEAARVFAAAPAHQSRGGRRPPGSISPGNCALARPPRPTELDLDPDLPENPARALHQHPEDAAKLIKAGIAPAAPSSTCRELAAWTASARVILNLHETITRY